MSVAVATQATTADWVSAIGQVAGAVFTLAAVIVALWLATRETRLTRIREAHRAHANAHLVFTDGPGAGDPDHDEDGYHFDVTVPFINHSDQHLFDARVELWAPLTATDQPPKWAVRAAIVKPGEEVPFKPRVTVDSHQLGFSAWRVRWTDVDGNEWCVDQRQQRWPEPFTGQRPRS